MLAQFLAPHISILKNIYDAVNSLGSQNNQQYDNLADIFQKTDSFDGVLFEKLKNEVKNELPPVSEFEIEVFGVFESMIEEIEMLTQSNKIRKQSLLSNGSGGNESDGLGGGLT